MKLCSGYIAVVRGKGNKYLRQEDQFFSDNQDDNSQELCCNIGHRDVEKSTGTKGI